ncbi:MAG: DUF3990 domain-containing protein [Lachnospiraceae bacterium]|nr:DUF3990 domain-containing protein [Lachnospiraceae bacterium]
MKIYHGSTQIVEVSEIRVTKFNKDFYFGFYCTTIVEQAERWATRFGNGYINIYEYTPNPDLIIKVFPEMSEEWMDFIAACRSGKSHAYDIVEGPMANDTIFNYVQDFLDGKLNREQFWELAKFKKPTHQISFHTQKALETLQFLKGDIVYE